MLTHWPDVQGSNPVIIFLNIVWFFNFVFVRFSVALICNELIIEHYQKTYLKDYVLPGRDIPGLVVMGGDLRSEGCEFEFLHHGHFSHLFVVWIVMFVWKDENILKRGREWPIQFMHRIFQTNFYFILSLKAYCLPR